MIQNIVAVAIGGGVGAVLRYLVTVFANLHGGIIFPYGTVLVNTIGSFFISLLMMYFAAHTSLPGAVKLFAVTGILGGFTTFSTFNMELLTFVRSGEMTFAVLYGGLNVIGAFICCWIGIILGEQLW